MSGGGGGPGGGGGAKGIFLNLIFKTIQLNSINYTLFPKLCQQGIDTKSTGHLNTGQNFNGLRSGTSQ
jgi:hypothetical protein